MELHCRRRADGCARGVLCAVAGRGRGGGAPRRQPAHAPPATRPPPPRCTGGFLQLRTGMRSAAKSAAFGGVLLAMIEGVGILLTRMTAPPPAPVVRRPARAAPPPLPASSLCTRALRACSACLLCLLCSLFPASGTRGGRGSKRVCAERPYLTPHPCPPIAGLQPMVEMPGPSPSSGKPMGAQEMAAIPPPVADPSGAPAARCAAQRWGREGGGGLQGVPCIHAHVRACPLDSPHATHPPRSPAAPPRSPGSRGRPRSKGLVWRLVWRRRQGGARAAQHAGHRPVRGSVLAAPDARLWRRWRQRPVPAVPLRRGRGGGRTARPSPPPGQQQQQRSAAGPAPTLRAPHTPVARPRFAAPRSPPPPLPCTPATLGVI